MRAVVLSVVVVAGCDRAFDLERPADAPPLFDAPTTYAQAVLDDRPAAYLRLDEPSGIVCADVIEGGPTGTALGGVTRGVAGALAGESNTAISLDGVNAAVSLGDTLGFEGVAPFTLEAWIKPTFTGHFQEIMSKWLQPPARIGWTFFLFDARLGFERDTSDAISSIIEYTGVTEGTYQHVVATFDGASMIIYVDGVQRGTQDAAVMLPNAPVPLLIGAANGNPGNAPFAGSIDEVAIYPTALSPVRVFEHYTAGIAP